MSLELKGQINGLLANLEHTKEPDDTNEVAADPPDQYLPEPIDEDLPAGKKLEATQPKEVKVRENETHAPRGKL
jgi:hypothetical protein